MAGPVQPIEVNPTAVPASVATAIRYIVVLVCGLAIQKKFLPVDTDVNTIVAIALAVAAGAYGVYAAVRNHSDKKAMLPYTPDNVARLKR
jgi:Na+/H+ antiporter NhaB